MIAAYVEEIFSSFVISIAEVIAVITFFILNEPKAYKRKPIRIFYTLLFLLVNYLIQHGLHKLNTVFSAYSIGITLALILLTIVTYTAFIRFWTGEDLRQAFFLGILFSLVDNCAWSIFGRISNVLWGSTDMNSGISVYIKILIIFLVEMLITLLVKQLLPPIGQIHVSVSILLLTISISCSYYYLRLIADKTALRDTSAETVSALIALVSMILIVYAASSNSKEAEKLYRMKTQNLLAEQQAQFQKQLTDIENVNRKYHDLKNMLLAVQADSTQMVSDLVRGLRPFESNIQTGNQTIDIVMTDKLSKCQEKDIACTPLINGQCLSFLDPLDLGVLFGNAMDNAMEACMDLSQKERRNITVETRQRANTVALIFRNTFAKAPRILEGLPKTSKEDFKNHGYGLRSMQMVTEKYGGQLTCRIEGEEFVLTILFFAGEN